MPLRLSVLDQSPIRKGGTPAEAVRDTLELAQLCDRLGYTRYWLAEHHSSEALAGSTPEVLITRVAGLTERMRIGSGGVMLPHYSAFKVAENFRMLETLFPGRIDVGIGRAPGSDQQTMRILADGKPNWSNADKYPYQVRDLVACMTHCRSTTRAPASWPSRAARRRPTCGCWDRATTARRWRRISDCPSVSRTSSIPTVATA